MTVVGHRKMQLLTNVQYWNPNPLYWQISDYDIL